MKTPWGNKKGNGKLRGRPPTVQRHLLIEACALVRAGLSVRKAAQFKGLSKATLARFVNPDAKLRQEENRWKRTYGIDSEDWARLYEAQNGLCPFCTKPLRPWTNIDIDHDHRTKRVRGLTHTHCNSRIGQLEKLLASPQWPNVQRYLRLNLVSTQ